MRYLKFVFIFLLSYGFVAAQDPNDEYYIPSKKKKTYPWIKNSQLDVVPLKYYLGIEGGFRKDLNTLSNNLDGLIGNINPLTNPWGVLVGAMYQNRWMFETGYYRTNVEMITQVNVRGVPDFRWQTKYTAIPLRAKRKLLSIGKIEKESGFYWEVGTLAFLPAKDEQIGSFTFRALRSLGQGIPADTLTLNQKTTVNGGAKLLLETGLDLNIKLLPRWDIGFYGRATLGLGEILRGEATFSGKTISTLNALHTARGNGYYFGMSIRYNYLIRDQYKSREPE